MSAVSIIGMKIAGYFRLSLGSTVFGPAPGLGVGIDSTPPATVDCGWSPRMEFGAIAIECRPDEQNRLIDTPPVVTGSPASSAAWRPILPAPCAQLPI